MQFYYFYNNSHLNNLVSGKGKYTPKKNNLKQKIIDLQAATNKFIENLSSFM